MKARLLLFALLASAAILFPAPGAFLLPGLALALLHDDRHPIVTGVLLSMAIWPVAFQVLYWIHVPLRPLTSGVLVASSAIVAWKIRKVEPRWDSTAILGTAALFRLLPAVLYPCASGRDMSLHTLIVRRILEEGHVPADLMPIDSESVWGIPIGFHFEAAALGLEANSASLWLSVAVYVAVTLALYRALVPFFPSGISALAAVAVSFLADKPQTVVRYGSTPLVLSFVLIVAALALWVEGMRGRLRPIPIALLAAASVVTHPTPPYGAIWIVVPALLIFAWRRFDRARIGATALALGLCVATIVPYVLGVRRRPVPEEMRTWTREYQKRGNSRITEPTGIRAAVGVVAHARHEMGEAFVWLSVLVLAYGTWRRRPLAALYGAFFLCWAAVALNVRVWAMPLSLLLYPDRVMHFLILPPAFLLASALEEGEKYFAGRPLRPWALAATLCAVAGFGGYRAGVRYLGTYGKNAYVTRSDLEAFAWMKREIPQDAVIANLEDDAGMWIPALAHRRITSPHGIPTYYLPDTQPLPRYVYVGRRTRVRDPAGILGRKARFERIFERDGAEVWALR